VADYLGTGNLSVEGLERAIRHALALHGEERQRRQAEAALRASEERFRALAENNFDALILLDAEGRITYMTLTHHELTRGSALLHTPFTPEVFARAVRRLLDV
jgi:PAS domain-containing protein